MVIYIAIYMQFVINHMYGIWFDWQQMFNDDYYEKEEDAVKPVWDDDELESKFSTFVPLFISIANGTLVFP